MRPSRIRRRMVLAAAVAPVLAAVPVARATGDFDGGQVAATRLWDVGGANPGINWVADTLPIAGVDPITLDTLGDGGLDLNALVRSQPGLSFKNWVSYTLSNGTFALSAGGSTITVEGSVSSTYGSDYFADGNSLTATLGLGGFAGTQTIMFTHPDTGVLRLAGPVTGTAPLALTRIAAGLNNRGVYFDNPNAGYSGLVTINTGTSARLLCLPGAGIDGRTGTGGIALNGGELHILSDLAVPPPPPPPFTVDQLVVNPISSVTGTIRADHNYTVAPLAAYAPGSQHILGSPGAPLVPGGPSPGITLDNTPVIGGAASITFTADNGQNFGTYTLVLGHAVLGAVGTRTVTVDNGARREGIAGSVLRTGPNRQEEQVVTVQVGPPGSPLSSLYDLNPVTGAGIPLVKTGSGVLQIGGNNTLPIFGFPASQGVKTVTGGVLRFMTGLSYGITGGPASPVTLTGVPAVPATPVSAAMGVGYDPGGPVPLNLFTTGGIAGQSGAYDIDVVGYASAFAPAVVPPNAPVPGTALRLGSSGVGSTGGAIGVYAPTGFYYLGGGGGTLTIAAGAALAAGGATVQMGTTGTLLPGRVVMGRPVATGGPIMLEAGTLQVPPGLPAVLAGGAFTAVGSYSLTLSANGAYAGAPGGAGGSFDGPGQLLLTAPDATAGFYAYGPGGTFGAAFGLSLNGGAIGFDGPVGAAALAPLFAALPAQYNVAGGAPMPSSLFGTIVAPAPPAVPTSILHLGGEYSAGVMAVPPGALILNNGILGVPVALLKSGNSSTLDLTANPVNPYAGGTGILGGEIMVNMPGQLGVGAVVISDGGVLHVVAGGPPVVGFPNFLRVANGPERRASTITVDGGLTASFSATALQAGAIGSVLQKNGGGILELLPAALGPVGDAANTWGVRASAGLVVTNQLPGALTSSNGAIVFDGGTYALASPAGNPATPIPAFAYVMAASPFVIPPVTRYDPDYGYGGIESFAGTASTMVLGTNSFFRITGARTSSLMGALTVNMGDFSVFKVSGNALADDTRGTGSINFNGLGSVQFTPGGGNILFPRDGAFTMALNNFAEFSGCPDTEFNGNLLFNSMGGSTTASIDGATVDNTTPVPIVTPSTWTIGGTGLTSWAGTVIKAGTESIPGVSGAVPGGFVTINRGLGASVSIAPGASLDIEYGTLNAGGTGDPFTDTTFPLVHLPVTNNSAFNITAGTKDVASIAGIGTTTVSAGATLLVGSDGPVTQANYTVNGTSDVGDMTISGTTSVGASPAYLTAHYIRGNGAVTIGTGLLRIKDSSLAAGVSKIATLTIAGGQLDLRDNKLIDTTDAIGTYVGTAGSYTGLTALIKTGRNGGTWNGTGGIITTQSKALSPNLPRTTIGIAKGTQVKPATATATALWGGQTITGTDTLLMYTYAGDANLDGKLDADDYGRIDTNIALPNVSRVRAWANGDFNYDGLIDVGDYGLIDVNIALPPVSRPTIFTGAGAGGGGLAGVAPVPEPNSVALLALSAATLLGRRRRPSQ